MEISFHFISIRGNDIAANVWICRHSTTVVSCVKIWSIDLIQIKIGGKWNFTRKTDCEKPYIGFANHLSSNGRQAPIWPYAALLLIGPLGRNFGDVGIIP